MVLNDEVKHAFRRGIIKGAEMKGPVGDIFDKEVSLGIDESDFDLTGGTESASETDFEPEEPDDPEF